MPLILITTNFRKYPLWREQTIISGKYRNKNFRTRCKMIHY